MSDSDTRPGFFARIFLAWIAYFRTLFDAEFAAGVVRLRAGALPPPREEAPAAPEPREKKKAPPPKLREYSPDAALQLLALLQREGRLVDFLEEDLSSASDADIGAAARVVHDGCRKALREHVTLAPVRSEDEGTKVTLEKGFDAASVRLVGNVVGEAPFTGTLRHRGWRAADVKLPSMSEGHDARVIAAAEVEL